MKTAAKKTQFLIGLRIKIHYNIIETSKGEEKSLVNEYFTPPNKEIINPFIRLFANG